MTDGTDWRPAIGDLLGGRYRVDEFRGEGTLGYVVRATDTLTDEVVACKLPRTSRATAADAIRSQYRFLRDLQSLHLAQPRTIERHPIDGGWIEFLVLEYVRGTTLDRWYPGKPIRERLRVVADLTETLGLLHGGQTQHGDLADENVMVAESGNVVLIDPEAERLGSLARKGPIAGNSSDRASITRIIGNVFASSEDRATVRAITDRLTSNELPPASLSDLAAGLRSIRTLPVLPGDSDRSLEALAPSYRAQVDADEELFRQIAEQRHVAFEALLQQIVNETMLFGLPLAQPDQKGREAYLRDELNTVDQPKGTLNMRGASVCARNGDRLTLSLNGATQFRRPWPQPDVPGLIDRGFLQVLRDERDQVIAVPVYLFSVEGSPQWFVSDGDKYRSLVSADLSRAVRVLIEQVYPGLRASTPLQETKSYPLIQLWDLPNDHIDGWCKARSLDLPSSPRENLARAIQMALAGSRLFEINSPRPLVSPMSLERFFEKKTYAERLENVRDAAAAIAGVFSRSLKRLDYLDVVISDPSANKLRVAIGGETRGLARTGVSTRWRKGHGRQSTGHASPPALAKVPPVGSEFAVEFDLDFPTAAMIVARVRAAPRLAEQRAKGKRRLSKGSRSKP